MNLGALFNPQGVGGPGQDTWASMFADPRLQGALLSIGGALAQPPQFGQTGFGHLLGSLGAGGESVRTQEALDTKQQEAESKVGLRESQAQLAESRANVAGANNTVAGQRLELQRQANADKNERNTLGNVIRFQRMYQDQVKAIQTANQRASLLGQPIQPVPTFKEWAAKSPQISSMLGLTSQDVGAADSGDSTSAPDTSAPAVDPNEGRTATGPGGKKMIYRGGQWQPL